MKRLLQIGNILSVVFALGANFVVGTQLLGLPGINEISDKYQTLLTPAGYAFSIWSLIYLLLVVFAVYQARDIVKPRNDNDLPQEIGPFFMIANICNGLWTYIFVTEWVGLSVIVLLILTASLYILLWRLRIAVYDAPRVTIACVWWPLLIYTGWVTVASVVNASSWLQSMGVTFSAVAACVVLVALAAALIALLVRRNVRELVLASSWGIVAVGVQQLQSSGSNIVATAAFVVGAILLLAAAAHGYRNGHSNPFLGIGEEKAKEA